MLEYSEYKNLIDTLEQSNNENTYQEVMQKESKVLDTINAAVNVYKEDYTKKKQLIHMPISQIVLNYFTVWNDIIKEVIASGNNVEALYSVFITGDRLVYIGITLVFLSIILYYVEISH